MKKSFFLAIVALSFLFMGQPTVAQDSSNPNIRSATDAPGTPLERLLTEAKLQYTQASSPGVYLTTFRGEYGETLNVYMKHQPENDLVDAWIVVVGLPKGARFPEEALRELARMNFAYPVIKWAIDFEHGLLGVTCQVPREMPPALFRKVMVTLAGAADREGAGLKQMIKQASQTVRTDD
jgi:hypothetical protein